MPENQNPDVQKFLTDPKFQKDREVFGAFIEYELRRRATESGAKEKPDTGSIWDFLFWKPKNNDQEKTYLQRIFDGE